ncbi:FDLD family class I lanthipeptide [Tumebacillus flagellatus]
MFDLDVQVNRQSSERAVLDQYSSDCLATTGLCSILIYDCLR